MTRFDRRAYGRRWARARRERWIRENGPCARCGSSERLEVDHIDPATKVSHRVWSWSRKRREAELAKCQVLCHECHTAKSAIAASSTSICGTTARYRAGCRCVECRGAIARYNRSLVGKAPSRHLRARASRRGRLEQLRRYYLAKEVGR